MNTPTKPVPPNVKEFNEITAVVLGEVYKSHPHPKTIQPLEIAKLLGYERIDVILPSGRSFQDMFTHTMMWLANHGLLNNFAAVLPHRCTLTARTLDAMNSGVGPAPSRHNKPKLN